MTKCKACGTEILWLRHHETGKKNPIEVEPCTDGNLVIDRRREMYRFATDNEKEMAVFHQKNLYISHFARCPKANKFRS